MNHYEDNKTFFELYEFIVIVKTPQNLLFQINLCTIGIFPRWLYIYNFIKFYIYVLKHN